MMSGKLFRAWHQNIHSFLLLSEPDVECDVVGTGLECRFDAIYNHFMKQVF